MRIGSEPWAARIGRGNAVAARIRLCATLIALAGAASPVAAQQLDQYLPQGVAGYGAVPGVTVLSRLRPLYEPPGLRIGGTTVTGALSSGLGYDSNATGQPRAQPSLVVRTDANLLARTNWRRHQVQLALALADRQYLAQPSQSTTSWNAGIVGVFDIGRHQASVGYTHVSAAQSPRDLSTPQLRAPVPYTTDSAQLAFTWAGARVSLTPSVEFGQWRYSNASQAGLNLNLTSQDRDVLTGNLLLRYRAAEGRSLLMVARGIRTRYLNRTQGQPSRDSDGVELLVGVEYAAGALWRYRILGGWQARSYASGSSASASGPVVEGSAIWQPTGLTSVTATALHTLAESALLTTYNYDLTQARLTIDHELRRNLLLQARADIGSAAYRGASATATLFNGGGSVTWLLNRRLRLIASYDYSQRRSGSGSFSEHITLLRLGVGL